MNKEDLLQVSKKDLLASRELYKKKIYAQALVFFHQSVEKATKYLALSIGGINELDLEKKIKHDNIKLFQELLKYLQANSPIQTAIDPHCFTNLKNKISTMSDQDRVNLIQKLIKDILDSPLNISETKRPLQAMIDYSKSIGINNNILLKEMSEFEYMYIEEKLKESIHRNIMLINWGDKIIQLLFSYSVLTNCYRIDEFRYPNEKLGNPIKYFNEENPFVKELGIFIIMLESTLDILGKVFKDNLNHNEEHYTQ